MTSCTPVLRRRPPRRGCEAVESAGGISPVAADALHPDTGEALGKRTVPNAPRTSLEPMAYVLGDEGSGSSVVNRRA